MLPQPPQGSYLWRTMTKSVLAQLATYNRDLQVYGYLRVRFTWGDAGQVHAKFLIKVRAAWRRPCLSSRR